MSSEMPTSPQPNPPPPLGPCAPSSPSCPSRCKVGLSSQKLQLPRLVGALRVDSPAAPGARPRPADAGGFETASASTVSKSQTPPLVKSVQPAFAQGRPLLHPVSAQAAGPPTPPLTSC